MLSPSRRRDVVWRADPGTKARFRVSPSTATMRVQTHPVAVAASLARCHRGPFIESCEFRTLLSAPIAAPARSTTPPVSPLADVVTLPLVRLSPGKKGVGVRRRPRPPGIALRKSARPTASTRSDKTAAGRRSPSSTPTTIPTFAADLAVFDGTYGLPPASLSVVNQYGSPKARYLPAADGGWAGEIALDVEWAHAIAPGRTSCSSRPPVRASATCLRPSTPPATPRACRPSR